MKLSKRLQTIADMVEKNDFIADVGCDHAYLSIYLALNRMCKGFVATEVANGPYDVALNNIKKYNLENTIKLYLTDGLTNVCDNLNTIIISGMGANTIINILKKYDKLNNIKKLIIQSNNDWELLRRFLNSKSFYIKEEKFICEKNKDYNTILAYKSNKNNSDTELEIGLYNPDSREFYQKQIKKLCEILVKISSPENSNYKMILKKIELLKKYIN